MQCDVHIESQAARLGSVDLNKKTGAYLGLMIFSLFFIAFIFCPLVDFNFQLLFWFRLSQILHSTDKAMTSQQRDLFSFLG